MPIRAPLGPGSDNAHGGIPLGMAGCSRAKGASVWHVPSEYMTGPRLGVVHSPWGRRSRGVVFCRILPH